ncbi:SGNH hydrolase domain-containing protein [Pseudomonas pergaminensis]
MLKRNHPDLVVFDPEPYFCPSGKCSLFKDGKLLLNDSDHLSKHGS